MALTEGWLGIALKENIRLITRCRSFTLTVVGYWPIVSSEASCTDIPSDPSRVFWTGADWLSRDPHEVDLYIADELCGFPLTIQSWCDFLDGKRVLGTKNHIDRIPKDLPVYVIGGTRDPVGKNAAGLRELVALYRQRGLEVECRFYEDARHELLNETNREEVTRDIIAWLDERPKPE